MLETRKTRRRDLGPGPSDPGGDDPASSGGIVTVTHGPYAEDLPVAQMSVQQVRQRFHDRLDIHPEAVALIDGSPVDDDAIVGEGQLLMFVRPAGEKGVGPLFAWATGKSPTPPEKEVVVLMGNEAHARLPEGTTAHISIAELVEQFVPGGPDTRDVVLPDGVKCALSIRGGVVLVHQTPPRVYNFQWISDDSEADFGPGTKYRTVRIALPYVVTLAVFEGDGRGRSMLTHRNECFFSSKPLENAGLETQLFYPALLNCSRRHPQPDDAPLSWVCTQHLSAREYAGRKTRSEALEAGLRALLRHLLESGFNRSSEMHEGSSWFQHTIDSAVDPRLASIETWEKASADDPLFVLDVPWLPVGRSLREVWERISKHFGPQQGAPASAGDIARYVINGRKKAPARQSR